MSQEDAVLTAVLTASGQGGVYLATQRFQYGPAYVIIEHNVRRSDGPMQGPVLMKTYN